MKSLDTTVLARLFVDNPDDPEAGRQRPAAIAALSERTYVSITVLLEFEWVMRGLYGLSTRDVVRVLRALAGIEQSTIEDRGAVLEALTAVEQGLDFADALHLARSTRAASFVTFDRRLAKRVKGTTSMPRVELIA